MKKMLVASAAVIALALAGCAGSGSAKPDEDSTEVVVTPTGGSHESDEACSTDEECGLGASNGEDDPEQSAQANEDFVAPDIDSDEEMFDEDPDKMLGDNTEVDHSSSGETVAYGTNVSYGDGVEVKVDLEKFEPDRGQKFCGANEGGSYFAVLKTTMTNGKTTGILSPRQDKRSAIVVNYMDLYGDVQEVSPSTANQTRDVDEFWKLLGYKGNPNAESDSVKRIQAGESWESLTVYCMKNMMFPHELGVTAKFFTGDGVIRGWPGANTYWTARG